MPESVRSACRSSGVPRRRQEGKARPAAREAQGPTTTAASGSTRRSRSGARRVSGRDRLARYRRDPGLLRQDGSPPLYYLLLHGWMALAGDGEAAARSLSLVATAAFVLAVNDDDAWDFRADHHGDPPVRWRGLGTPPWDPATRAPTRRDGTAGTPTRGRVFFRNSGFSTAENLSTRRRYLSELPVGDSSRTIRARGRPRPSRIALPTTWRSSSAHLMSVRVTLEAGPFRDQRTERR
jgi:hypothetical protein